MPTLLQINSTLNYSSTGKIAEQIGLLAKARGWKSFIAHGPRYVRPTENYAIQVGSSFSEKLHGIASLLLDRHGQGSVMATKILIQKINDIQPDIIHLHNIHGYYINYKILFDFLKRYNRPVVWTLHDCWPFTGHCVYFDAVGCNLWLANCGKCPQINSYPKSLFIDRSIKNLSEKKQMFSGLDNMIMVPVSNWLGGLVKQSYLGTYPIKVIHNGIDLNTFKPRASDLRIRLGVVAKYVILGVASGWAEGRRLSDFIKLAVMSNNDEVFVLVGLTDEQISSLPSNIIGIRRTANQIELAQYYSMADVFVYPTYEDNFPTVNLEALACGTPVITYQTGGSPEAIDEDTGIVVCKGDVCALHNAIQSIRKTPLLRENCRLRAEKLFDNKVCFCDYFALYDKFLENDKQQ